MERTMQVLATHFAEVVFRHCGQPGHHARTCPILLADREQQQQHILTPASTKPASTAPCTPLQRLWGCKAHAQTCTRTHTCTHTCACAHTYEHKRAQKHTGTFTHIHMHTHKHTHTHTRTHTCICVAHVMGIANFSASLVTLPYSPPHLL
jgi:hypothetical protein